MKEIFEKVGAGREWRAELLKKTAEACLSGAANKDGVIDAKGAVLTISEMNKMDGSYAPETHAHLIGEDKENKISELIGEYEKEF